MGSIVERNQSRISKAVRMPNARRRDPIELEPSQAQWSALVNITREQVQAVGRGEFLTLNPGEISNKRFNCVRFIKRNVALKMRAKKKRFLRIMPAAQGKRLMEEAQKLQKQGHSEPFFAALGRLIPRYAAKTEIDVARDIKEMKLLRQQVSELMGETVDQSWTKAKLISVLKNVEEAYADEADGKDVFDLTDTPKRREAAEIDFEDVPDEPEPPDATEDDEPAVDPVRPVSQLRAEVNQSEDAELAAVNKQLKALGLKVHGRTSLDKKKDILARALANKSAAG